MARRKDFYDNPTILRCCPAMVEATGDRYIVVDDEYSGYPIGARQRDDLMGLVGDDMVYCPWCGTPIATSLAIALPQLADDATATAATE